MKKRDVIAYYETAAKAAKALKTDQSNITRWPAKVPELWACKLHLISGGALQYRDGDYPPGERFR